MGPSIRVEVALEHCAIAGVLAVRDPVAVTDIGKDVTIAPAEFADAVELVRAWHSDCSWCLCWHWSDFTQRLCHTLVDFFQEGYEICLTYKLGRDLRIEETNIFVILS